VQLDYVKAVGPRYASLKRNADWGSEDMLRIKGSSLKFQVCTSDNGSEWREWFLYDGIDFSLEPLPILVSESTMMYYNGRVRKSYHEMYSPLSGCNCHDCMVLGLSYLRALHRMPGSFRDLFAEKFAYNFSDSEKLEVHSKKALLSFGLDIFGFEISGNVDYTWTRYPSGQYEIFGNSYYLPSYRNYGGNGLTTMVNGVLVRYDLKRGLVTSCPRHIDPGEFPFGVLVHVSAKTGMQLFLRCGCKLTVTLKGDLGDVITLPLLDQVLYPD